MPITLGVLKPDELEARIRGRGTLAPERRHEIVGLGFKAIVGGTLATCCTGAVVGLIGGVA